MSNITAVFEAQVVVSVEEMLIINETVPIGLVYDPSNPGAVTAILRPEPQTETMVSFARSMMADSLKRPVGYGNVTIRAIRKPIETILFSAMTETMPWTKFILRIGPYVGFLVATYNLVPEHDEERVNADAVDAALTAMFPTT